jgi:hypothetical protein
MASQYQKNQLKRRGQLAEKRKVAREEKAKENEKQGGKKPTKRARTSGALD